MPEGSKEAMGGTMRLGSRATLLREGSFGNKIYGATTIHERHRHRYEAPPTLDAPLLDLTHALFSAGKAAAAAHGALAAAARTAHALQTAASQINPSLVPRLEEAGLHFSGKDDSGIRAEVIELDPARFDHPFFFGLQGHPEYKSRPLNPSPPFLAFVRAAAKLPSV